MALKNVADTPFVANVSHELARAGAHLKKVPLNVWRFGFIALALVWICFSLARLFWFLMPSPDIPAPPVVAVQPESTGTSSGRSVDIAGLQALGLFGDFNAEAAAQAEESSDEPRPITSLNLELQGVIASSDPMDSWAIIGKSAGEQKLYKIDDEIEDMRGVKVAEVLDLKVVLNNNGRLEDLWLYGEDGKNFSTAAAGYTPPQQQQSSPPPPARASVSEEQLQEARNIGDVVRFVVATENGKMIGYKVRPGRKRALFDQVGLKSDDVVVSVNGIEVNEPQKIREVYQALKNASEAELQIMRDGATQSITISMSSEG